MTSFFDVFIVAIMSVMFRLGEQSLWINGLYDAVCILILFPVIVSMGAGSEVKGARSTAICKFYAAIPFPIYLLSILCVYALFMPANYRSVVAFDVQNTVYVGFYILVVPTVYAALRLYDLPVRSWLKQKLFTFK